jgi:hypothetical protein
VLPDCIHLFYGKIINEVSVDFNTLLSEGTTKLGDLVIWINRKEKEFKLLVGGNNDQAALYSKHLYLAEINGGLAKVRSEKILR